MKTHTFITTLMRVSDDTQATAIPVTFEPREVFGMARVPVVVAINGHTYRSTICNMGSGHFLPLAKVHRDAAGVEAGQEVSVTLTHDEAPRVIAAPRDLAAALRKDGLLDAFKAMSFTHQKEHVLAVEGAKQVDTRRRRIAACVAMVREWEAKKRAKKRARAAGVTKKGQAKRPPRATKKAGAKKAGAKKAGAKKVETTGKPKSTARATQAPPKDSKAR